MAYAGYEPLNYIPDYSWISKVGLQAGEAVKQFPGLIEETRNFYRNKEALPAFKSGVEEQIRNFYKNNPDAADLTGMTEENALAAIPDPQQFQTKDKGEYIASVYQRLTPVFGAIGTRAAAEKTQQAQAETRKSAAEFASSQDAAKTAGAEKQALTESSMANREAGNIPFAPINAPVQGTSEPDTTVKTGYVAPEKVEPQRISKEKLVAAAVEAGLPQEQIDYMTQGRLSEKDLADQEHKKSLLTLKAKMAETRAEIDRTRAANNKRALANTGDKYALDAQRLALDEAKFYAGDVNAISDSYEKKIAPLKAELTLYKAMGTDKDGNPINEEAANEIAKHEQKIKEQEDLRDAAIAAAKTLKTTAVSGTQTGKRTGVQPISASTPIARKDTTFPTTESVKQTADIDKAIAKAKAGDKRYQDMLTRKGIPWQ